MSKNVLVFDTETIGVDKKFCYNVGYVVVNIDDNNDFHIIDKKEFMTKQVWYNKMLYSTAYYAQKKPIYTQRIREKKIRVLPFEEIINEILTDIEKYNINYAFAYNSNFDEQVFAFMSDWFKTINPFEEINIYDIRTYFVNCVDNNKIFYKFCEDNKRFTESGNYSTTAETAYQYITGIYNFEEEHTALSDSIIETEILEYCTHVGIDIFSPMKAKKSLPRLEPITLTINYKGEKITMDCYKYTVYRKRNVIKIE